MQAPRPAKARGHAPPDFDSLVLDRGFLYTPDGALPVKKIGKGMFADVYREETGRRRVFVFADDDVYDKEILCMAHNDLPHNPHIPATEKFGSTRDKQVYVMQFYNAPLRKGNTKPADWGAYLDVKGCVDRSSRGHPGYTRNQEISECIKGQFVRESLVEAFESLVYWAANYDESYAIEFSPRNLASDSAGNLVLLDILYNQEAVHRKRAQPRRATRALSRTERARMAGR